MQFNFLTRLPEQNPVIEQPIIIEERIPAKIYNKYKEPVQLFNMFENQSIFLTLSGPSFLTNLNDNITIRGITYSGRELLSMPGVMTMGVNNSPKTFRPTLWIMGDDVKNFLKSIWMDPRIMKFCPAAKLSHKLFNNDPEVWEEMDITVKDCPNMFTFERNEHFDPETYLTTDTVNWGEHSKSDCALGIRSKRSVMLLAIRILHTLGFKNVYLLGCDFKMDENYKYHFSQDRAHGSIVNNNKIYDALQKRFTSVQPHFKKTGFNVFNCNSDSALTAFPYKSFKDAIIEVVENFPDTVNENSEGLYDRKANNKKQKETK